MHHCTCKIYYAASNVQAKFSIESFWGIYGKNNFRNFLAHVWFKSVQNFQTVLYNILVCTAVTCTVKILVWIKDRNKRKRVFWQNVPLKKLHLTRRIDVFICFTSNQCSLYFWILQLFLGLCAFISLSFQVYSVYNAPSFLCPSFILIICVSLTPNISSIQAQTA